MVEIMLITAAPLERVGIGGVRGGGREPERRRILLKCAAKPTPRKGKALIPL
jgi:hypothetical protein